MGGGCGFPGFLKMLLRPLITGDKVGLEGGKGTSEGGSGWKTERLGCCSYTPARTSALDGDKSSSPPASEGVEGRCLSALLSLDHMLMFVDVGWP